MHTRPARASKTPPKRPFKKVPGPKKAPGPKNAKAQAKAKAKAKAKPGFDELDALTDRLNDDADVRDAVLLGKLTGVSRKAVYDGAHDALRTIITLLAIVTSRRDMRFTPCNIGDGVRWNGKGCGKMFVFIFGHFETYELMLYGVLLVELMNGHPGELRAPIWNLLAYYVGLARLRRCVIWNLVPFTAKNTKGNAMWLRVPRKTKKLIMRLQVQVLNAVGRPNGVCSFGSKVSTRP